MAKVVALKRIQFRNPFKAYRRAVIQDTRNFPKREAAFTQRRAKSIMRKSPMRPRSVYGGYVWRRKKTYQRQRQQYAAGARKDMPSAVFFRKGMYSPPGKPPYWHTPGFNLRKIEFHRVGAANLNISYTTRHHGGAAYAYRVGPVSRAKHFGSMPVPQLHEYGGTMTISLKWGKSYQTRVQGRNKKFTYQRARRSERASTYPARPYMRPAAQEARVSALRKSPHSMKKLFELGYRSNSKIKPPSQREY